MKKYLKRKGKSFESSRNGKKDESRWESYCIADPIEDGKAVRISRIHPWVDTFND